MSQVFLSEGFTFLPNVTMDTPRTFYPFPFLEVQIENWFGLSHPTTSPFIKAHKAKLYTEIQDETVGAIHDVNNRSQVEPFIKPTLEVYFIAHCVVYQESIQFQFQNTRPISNGEVPSQITPLRIQDINGELTRLFADQETITNLRVTAPFIPTRGLQPNEDLSNQKFSLVKPSGYGAILRGAPIVNSMDSYHTSLENTSQAILSRTNDDVLVKSLDFLRRALVLERSGFSNEAYLNYFRIIEAFADSWHSRIIRDFLQETFNLTRNQADNLINARSQVTAHGTAHLHYLREVGQKEMYHIQQYASQLVELRLS